MVKIKLMAIRKFVILLIILLPFPPQVIAMPIFISEKSYLFSPSKLTITKNGIPIRDAKVIRRWECNEELQEDSSYTDDNGFVEFNGIKGKPLSQLLPVQFFVAQQLAVVVDDREEIFWEHAKMKPSENSELEGNSLILTCEINDEEHTFRFGGTELYTKCKWQTDDGN